jgi:hypothetical protein
MPRCLATVLLPLVALTIGAAGASEPDWIAEDPAGITGPAAVPVGEAAMTFGFAQTQARSGRARGTSLGAVEAEAGIAPRLDLRFVQALGYGRTGARLDESEAPAWGGLSQLGLRVELAEQQGWLPAIGLLTLARTEYGSFRPMQEVEGVALFAAALQDGPNPLTAHLNLAYASRLDPEPGERPGRYGVRAALSQAVAPATLVGLTWLNEQGERGEHDANLLLASARHRLAENLILGAEIGTGVGPEGPAFVAGLSLKWILGGR